MSAPLPLRRLRYSLAEGAKAHLRRVVRARQLEQVVLRPGARSAQLLAVAVVRDEQPRLAHFLEHYRRAGVGHFLVVDNGSTDGTAAELARHPDVSVWRAHGEYRLARYGVDWVNAVLARHARGRWVLHVDVDELLVAHGEPDQLLTRLTRELDGRGQRSLQAVMLDMYSTRPPEANHLAPGQDPLEVTPLLDGAGYRRYPDPLRRLTWVKGGVRGRLYFADDPWAGPALNKTPLVRWRRRYAYLKSAHELWPSGLNGGAPPSEAASEPASSPLGARAALLHFKFTSTAVARMRDPEHTRQHTAEYGAYARGVDAMTGPPTVRYTGPGLLVELGVLAPG